MKKEFLALGAVLIFFFVIGILMTYLGDGSQYKIAELSIGDNKFTVEIADTPSLQAKGLSGRASLPQNRGMLFEFSGLSYRNFWMKGMKFPLDIIWIRGDEIVGFVESVPPADDTLLRQGSGGQENPPIYSSPEPVDRVLELNAGLVQKLGIKAGDRIEVK